MPEPTAQEPTFASSADEWKARAKRGPFDATLPSGIKVTFRIPDSNALLRADRLPDRLTEIATMAAAYPGGAEGYMEDLALQSARGSLDEQKLRQVVRAGLELRDWLVAEMLIEPEIEAGDVQALPEADVEMLLAFAERSRDTDATGVKLPIIVLERFATFRDERGGDEDDGAREPGDPDIPAVDSRANGG
jgi:hypothetical protein